MKGLGAVIALVGASIVLPGVVPGASASPPPTVRLVVELDDVAKAGGLDVERSLPRLDAVVVEVAAGDVATAIAELRERGAGRVEVDRPVRAASEPRDPLWTEQWGPQLVDAAGAWNRTTGAPTTRIAILDTGIDRSHPDLIDAVVAEVDLQNGDLEADDDNGHGTEVAGIVAARHDNDLGVAGYCPRCSLLSAKVLNADGVGDSSVVAAGIVWAVDSGASVINLSLSSPSSSFVLGDAIEYAIDQDVVVVGAVGNDGLLQPTYPAAYPSVLGVMASDPADSLYRWSNRGTWAAIAAPGCHRTTSGASYADLCGTSSSSPAVAGIAGLARSAAPDASAAAVRAAILDSATSLRGGGTRRVRAADAVDAVLRRDRVAAAGDALPGAPGAPRGVRVDADGLVATISWSAPADAGASPILDYVVTTEPGGAEQVAAAGETRATIGGLLDDVTYRFSVAARNAIGRGSPSDVTPPVSPTSRGVTRVAGASRILTSVALSERSHGRADMVVIARADEYADALAAAPLAAKLGAPLLLSERDAVSAETGREIRRLGARVAHLVGGPGALSPALAANLAAFGVTNVVRTAGANRYETASMIANEIGGDFAYVASGESGWADAVSAASLAAAQGRPVLLTARDRLPAATARGLRDLSVTSVVIVGGEASVGAAVLDAVADQNDDGFDEVAVTRVAGTDRYDTSRRMADVAISAGADPSRVWLASGHSWPDALATGPAVAARGGVFLLVPGDDLEAAPATATWLSAHAPELEEIVLVGGAASIGDRAVDQITRRVVMTRD